MGDQAADAELEPEAEGHGAGERADHDDVARAGVALAARDRVEDSSDSLLILHFILESLEGRWPSSPTCYMNTFRHSLVMMWSLLRRLCSTYVILSGRSAHEQEINQLVQRLSVHAPRRVVIFITTCSHDITGDLYVSPDSCALVLRVSWYPAWKDSALTTLMQVMGVLLPSVMATFLCGKEASMWMMSCGPSS